MTTTIEPGTLPERTLPAPLKCPAPSELPEARRQPPYAVVLHNDDLNGFDFVIGVLRKVFNYGWMKAFWLTLKAHLTGQSIVWSGSLEVAELKAARVRSCGPDPKGKKGVTALTVTVEPLPD
jgi:ATP-dependent Clp protease adaptor protein ClpS